MHHGRRPLLAAAITLSAPWLIPTRAAESPGSPPVQVIQEAIQPQVAIDDRGTVHVVAIHDGNITVSTSTDRGRTFGPPVVAIDAKGKARGGMQRGPRIGVDAKGRLTVTAPLVFDEAEFSKKYPTNDLYVATSADAGKTWTAPLRVNEVPKKAPEALHWMAVAPSGDATIVWLDLRERKQGQDIYLASFRDGKVGANRRIASEVCECCAPGLAIGAGGTPAVAYREGGSKPSREIYLLAPQGGGDALASAIRVNRASSGLATCPMSAPAVAFAPGGATVAVAWMDNRSGPGGKNVYWAFRRDGKLGPDEAIHRDLEGDQDHPSLAFDPSGTLWAAWEDRRSKKWQIRVRTSKNGDADRAVTDEGEGRVSFPSLATGGGMVGLAYEVNRGGDESIAFRVLATGVGPGRD